MLDKTNVVEYFSNALKDIRKAIETYPFIEVISPPTVDPVPIQLNVVAVNAQLIEITHATRSDFIGLFSREIEIIIPFDYKNEGCKVYGGKWINIEKVKEADQHFLANAMTDTILFA